MAEKKIKLPIGSVELDATEVSITERNEAVNEYRLEDGSVIRVVNVVTQIIRLDGSFDNDGNPIYVVRTGNVVTTISAPQNLRRQ